MTTAAADSAADEPDTGSAHAAPKGGRSTGSPQAAPEGDRSAGSRADAVAATSRTAANSGAGTDATPSAGTVGGTGTRTGTEGGGEERPRRQRGEQTRQLILETALRLFRERGYTETTMRAIAKEAGVAVGNAYYYFDSKEHLIQGFYDQNQAAHRVASGPVLAREKEFAARLRGVLHAGVDVNDPYHSFAATFFKTAAEPSSPLSPFSRESSPAREAAIAIFRDVVEGSSAKLDPELRKVLPELLWLGWMGVVLFWVYDRSPDRRRTRRLIDGIVPLIDRLVGLSRLRVLRPALRQVLGLLDTIREDD
ncbi:TetR/AcrR family transcriptional regulator [Couchioplanes caeruleus]|uniref:TetR/AcrR family transcriptional regulator n=1 Tax=Couchioplanes caeruleus TaxID=56438 RepID=UPI001FD006EF|nr:TetR family transcriptional regulator [Couchioplanes caeruleus]